MVILVHKLPHILLQVKMIMEEDYDSNNTYNIQFEGK